VMRVFWPPVWQTLKAMLTREEELRLSPEVLARMGEAQRQGATPVLDPTAAAVD
jgi:hypothetical protein